MLDRPAAVPPRVPPLQLALRFLLELAALAGLARLGLRHGGVWAAVGLPALAATAWVTFAVRGDPSRSGRAPVPVPGVLRLLLEAAVLALGAAGLSDRPALLAADLLAIAWHHAGTVPRLRWLVRQPAAGA